jgi:hypothetical protein
MDWCGAWWEGRSKFLCSREDKHVYLQSTSHSPPVMRWVQSQWARRKVHRSCKQGKANKECRGALIRIDVSEDCIATIIRVFLRSVIGLLITTNVVPSSPILDTLMMVAIRSSQTSVLTRATRRNIPEDDILHSYRCENLKSYIALTDWAL